ncbi:DUF515 domain-containing protein [Methanobacterium sp.]|uniref:DUF515 domain-containing protein n=1 Tax=Methanobacterium sp. TaxID=2164 RepID=UPI0025EF5F3C|nr:RcpC/CpaB family pilus assembly protein [Methanobacterium sp.]MBI5459267.1 DUF515 domain-containing protein [Methanobacterium sp.]MDY9923781.1 RcpC/CpaB family pilus assembly protein [Methanobacterium sp.]
MLDKILGKKDKDKKDVPDLRKEGKKADSDIGGRLKGMVSKATEKSKEKITNNNSKGDDGKLSSGDKKPRPMPKPRPIPKDKPTLKPPLKKQPQKKGRFGGIGSAAGFGKGVPDDDQRTLVGAAVFGIILIVLVGAGYYFLVFAPYQDAMTAAKQTKITEVNTYFKGALALDPRKTSILAEIDGGTTPEMVLAVDVLGPATESWREYQNQQIEAKKDPYGRVMITYAAGGQKNLMMKVADAQKIVNEADATVLANMEIKTPDTVAVPIIITRLQAAGGLINVGDSVDVYLTTTNASATTTAANNTTTNQTATTQSTASSPTISGATVLAILRAKDSGTVGAQLEQSQEVAVNTLTMTTSRSQTASTDVEELLKAAASNTWNEAQVTSLLNAYGWRLSDFERASNLGELDVRYMVVLEVPRENALFLMQNSQSLQLTVPTQNAPEWMITELKRIYGTG